MKRKLLGYVLAGTTISAIAGVAWAEARTGIHGKVCRARSASDQQYLGYDTYGVRNNSTTRDIAIDCELGYSPPTSAAKDVWFAVWSSTRAGIACDLEYMNPHGGVLITYVGAIRSVGNRGQAEWVQGPVSSTAEHFGYARCVLQRANANYGPNYLSSISIRAQ